MRNRAAIWLCVAFAALAALLPLGRLVAQSEPIAPSIPDALDTPVAPPATMPAPRFSPPRKAAPDDHVPRLLVNTRRIRLNYTLADVGPSGVSAVELWATRDGRSWQCYSNEPPPAGPLLVHVAEEGRYGFFLVVKSGVGLKSPTPKTGDLPQVWVEVDETAPAVKLADVRAGKGVDAGMLLVSWSASDAQLTPRPVTISTAPSKDGPWAPIAGTLENTGRYAWQMPKEMPYEFYVKVEAADQAGNVGAACTHEPVRVDLARPKGTILGVDSDKKPEPKPTTAAAPELTVPVAEVR